MRFRGPRGRSRGETHEEKTDLGGDRFQAEITTADMHGDDRRQQQNEADADQTCGRTNFIGSPSKSRHSDHRRCHAAGAEGGEHTSQQMLRRDP